ncbi:ROK family transcriptional regulator [Homoserinibacter sp. YIM 151385]|uniref:ROK family transcriptional regulator n=1 Tax=Homoserinibacter sp. YIM 151385 TaxID=2985506 RepID=UPI0022F01CC5|nr:ROK family transcriptional regulator [Homoserinibacter sp. YIM 151385]WBU38020.1 ROK family transcriptional regulator [Homoserinibacter sp. YIM 151385]
MLDPLGGTDAHDVLALFRAHGALTRAEVMQRSGLSRSTVNQRLSALERAGLIEGVGGAESTGGRPSTRFDLVPGRARILVVDIGASGFVAAVCDLAGRVLADDAVQVAVWDGPERVLGLVQEAFARLPVDGELWSVAIAVPGPVEFAAGRVVKPPIMTGWDGFDIAGWLGARYGVPIVVENDANARSVAEARSRGVGDLIAVKLGTGIGAGLVSNGAIIRGDRGAAGDIGHTRATQAGDAADARQCRCGNVGCVEAYGGGWAIMRDLEEAGIEVAHVSDVARLVAQGDLEALRLVRAAGRVIGDAIASLVSVLNPNTVALSGQLAECGEVIMSGIRERVHQRASPLATSGLVIERSSLGGHAGVTGLAIIAVDGLLARR